MKRSEFIQQVVIAKFRAGCQSAELAVSYAFDAAQKLIDRGVPFDPEDTPGMRR